MDVAGEKYVSIVTFRTSGAGVPTPVWIAPMGPGRAGFTTNGTSGKVKRIRKNSAVTLQRCTMRGVVDPTAPVVHATAEVVEGAAYDEVRRAIRAKYGWQARLVDLPGSIMQRFGRDDTSVGIVVTVQDPAP